MPKYRNLEAELKRKNITRKDLAEAFNLRYATITDKLSGKTRLTLNEAIAIKQKFFPDLSIEYLFDSGVCVCAGGEHKCQTK